MAAHPTPVTRRSRQRQDGPAVLVGHSYGGAVISEAGTCPAVPALVCIAAFAPDKGDSADTLIADPPPGAGTTDPAAPVRLPLPRPRQVPGPLQQADLRICHRLRGPSGRSATEGDSVNTRPHARATSNPRPCGAGPGHAKAVALAQRMTSEPWHSACDTAV